MKKPRKKYDLAHGWKFYPEVDGFKNLVIDRVERYRWYPIALVLGTRRQANLRGRLIASSIKLIEATVIALNEIAGDNPHAQRTKSGWQLMIPDCSCGRCKAMRAILSAIEEAGGEEIVDNEYVRGGPSKD